MNSLFSYTFEKMYKQSNFFGPHTFFSFLAFGNGQLRARFFRKFSTAPPGTPYPRLSDNRSTQVEVKLKICANIFCTFFNEKLRIFSLIIERGGRGASLRGFEQKIRAVHANRKSVHGN